MSYKEKKKAKSSPNIKLLKANQISEYLPFLKKCNHMFEGNNEFGMKDNSCFLCKITNKYINDVIYVDENKKNQEMLINYNIKKKKKKIFLLFLWSHCQSSNYLINHIQNYSFYDLIFSSEILLKCSKLIQLNSIAISNNTLTSKNKLSNVLDFNFYLKRIFYLRKLAIFGNFAAIFIQSHIRKFLARVRVRRIILKRFEYIDELSSFDSYRDFYIKKSLIPVADNSSYNGVNMKQYVAPTVSLVSLSSDTKEKYFYFYDTKTSKRWERYPLILKNEPPGTPRTINRRLQYEEVTGNSKLKFFNEKILKKFNENISTLSMNKNQTVFEEVKLRKTQVNPSNNSFFLQREIETIEYIKNIAVIYDLLSITFLQMKERSMNKNSDFKLRLTFSAPTLTARNIGLKIAMNKAKNMLQYNEEKDESNLPLASSSSFDNRSNSKNISNQSKNLRPSSPGLIPSNPSTPINSSRSRPSSGNILGKPKIKNASENPALDLLKNTFKKKFELNTQVLLATASTNSNKTNMSDNFTSKNISLQNSLQKLEELIYDSLNCKNVDEIFEILLNPELTQFYSRVNNLFEDELDIWNHSRIYPQPDNSSKDDGQQNAGVIPYYISLKNISPDTKPNGLFRLFFLDEELVCVSAVSPHCYFPEVYKNKDSILNSIQKFISTPEINQMIQDYYYNARLKFHPSMIQQVLNNSSYTPLMP